MSGSVAVQSVDKYVETAIILYGKKVIEDRAIPDFRDGLKPVQRRLLWTLNVLGNRERFVKAAKIIGTCMGSYHPHSDMALHGAIATMVNLNTPLIEGQGNWGNPATGDNPAAARYVEARLSKFSSELILGREYLEVIDYVDNYDGTTKEPVVLPALVPAILMTAAYGIGVGVGTSYPPLSLKFIKFISLRYLLNKNGMTAKEFGERVEFDFPQGGKCLTPPKELEALFGSSEASCSVTFQSLFTIDEKTRTLNIESNAANLNMEDKAKRIIELPEVQSVMNHTSKTIRYVITFKSSVAQKDIEPLARSIVEKFYTQKISFRTFITERKVEDGYISVDFGYAGIDDIMKKWTEWRIALEVRLIKKYIEDYTSSRHTLKILLKASKMVVALAREVAKKHHETPLVQRVAKLLSVSQVDAEMVLGVPLKSLSSMEQAEIRKKINNLSNGIALMKQSLSAPQERCAETIRGSIRAL